MWVPTLRIGSSRWTLRLSRRDAARVLDRVGDVLRGDRAEQAAVVAGLLRDREHGLVEQRGVLARALSASRAARSAASWRSAAASSAPFVAGCASLRGIRKLRR